jgi:hypothetical protein
MTLNFHKVYHVKINFDVLSATYRSTGNSYGEVG